MVELYFPIGDVGSFGSWEYVILGCIECVALTIAMLILAFMKFEVSEFS